MNVSMNYQLIYFYFTLKYAIISLGQSIRNEGVTLKQIVIRTEYITLGQFIKYLGLVGTGGEEKEFLASHSILINQTADTRRGRKLRKSDVVSIDGTEYVLIADEN